MVRPRQLTRQDIIWLFDVVWPRMDYSAVHRDLCLARLKTINRIFSQFSGNPNQLLNALDALDDIGLVIGSGLIFASDREIWVPFDKYTMGWALELKLIPDNRISRGNYVEYSQRIVEYVRDSDHLDSILDFVREADDNAQFPFSPE